MIPADDPRPSLCADLVSLLQTHGIEIHRLSGGAEIGDKDKKTKFPTGSYVIRMDQPYSRLADMLLDTQFYNAHDTPPYDDTGWSLGPLRNIRTIRVTDAAILKAPMSPVTAPVRVPGAVTGSGKVLAVDHTAEPNLATFRFRLRDMKMLAAEEPFDAAGHKFAAGTFLIEDSTARDRVSEAAQQLGVKVYALPQMPKVATHPLAAPRVALVHTWTDTQNEGWFRYAFDQLGIPYDYISGQKLRTIPNLRDRWDVILLGPTPDSSQDVVNGLPMRGDAIPWKNTDLTPNLGNSPDTTDDMRGGMGLEGLLAIRRFVEDGGLFVTIAGNASIPIDFGLIEAVSITPSRELKVRGSVVNAVFSDAKSPIAYGYGERLPVYFNQSPVFSVSRTGGLGFGGGRQ